MVTYRREPQGCQDQGHKPHQRVRGSCEGGTEIRAGARIRVTPSGQRNATNQPTTELSWLVY